MQIGNYETIRIIGQGGMATVYLAMAPGGERVALKVIRAEFATNHKYLARFNREYKTMLKIEHPSIIRLIDFGVHEGLPFCVLEYIPCKTLEDILEERKRLPQSYLLGLSEQFLSAMTVYSGLRLVHRDLKPSNLMIREDGRLVIMDFGLVFDADATALTATGDILGTPAYIPPEMVMGLATDIRSDIYQMGVILYRCITGIEPYKADNPTESLKKAMTGDCRPVRELAPATSRAFAAFVSNCMASMPEDRYSTPEQALADLSKVKRGTIVPLLHERPDVAPDDRTAANIRLDAGKARPLLTLLFVLTLLFGLIRLLSGTTPVPNPSITRGYRRVLLKWKSSTSLRTRVEIRDASGRILLRRDDPGPVREHRFSAAFNKGIEAGATARMIVLPRGPSSQPVRFGVRPFRPRINSVEHTGTGTLFRFALASRPHATTVFRITATDIEGKTGSARAFVDNTNCRAIVPALGPGLAKVRLSVADRETGENFSTDLDEQCRRWAERVFSKVERIDPVELTRSIITRLVSFLVVTISSKPHVFRANGSLHQGRVENLRGKDKAKIERILADIRKRMLDDLKPASLFELAKCQSVILSSSFLPDHKKPLFFERAQLLNIMNHCCIARHWYPLQRELAPFGPDWKFYWTNKPPSSEAWSIGAKWILSEHNRLAAARFSAFTKNEGKSCLIYNFVLNETLSRRLKSVCLAFHTGRINHRLYLRFYVNGHAFLASDHLTSTIDGEPSGDWFCQHMPSFCLNPGNNSIRVMPRMYPGFFECSEAVNLDRILVLLELSGR